VQGGWAPAVAVRPRTVRIALLGMGTVGTGIWRLLTQNREDIERKVGRGIEVVRALVRDPGKERPVDVPTGILTSEPDLVLADPDVRVVVEVMGGIHPALEYVVRALRAGRTVVTANKDVMAEHGQEVWAAAAQGGADVFFEASVGGGIPIVRALKESLAANRVHRVAGILNGTTNFILTRMTRDGVDQAEALREAQALGYAEADPSADLDGLDAARKLAILSSIAYSSRCLPRDVYRQGIRDVTARDIAHAERMGWVVKLLAISELRDGRVSMRVHPTLVPRAHPLASVHDAFNAIYVQGDAVGEAMFYGRGAGAMPTASAVVGDLMQAVRFLDRGGAATGCTCFYERPVAPLGELEARFYVRLLVPDRVGVLAKIAGAFGQAGVSILSVLQAPVAEADRRAAGREDLAELILVTHAVREDRMAEAMAAVRRLDVVAGVGAVLRLAPEDL
jgi:homoserine dehydrogenase